MTGREHILRSVPVVLLVGLVLFTALPGIASRDDSDPPGGRSELWVRTDCLTGLQYLVAPGGGGITPRLGADGTQIENKGACQ